jgi:hypothetical protein
VIALDEDRKRGIDALFSALEKFDAASMRMEAAAVRWHLGQITNDETLRQSAISVAAVERVADPARWFSVLLPVEAR